MSRIDRDRRKFLAAGSTAAAISLAGCSSVILNRLGGDGDSEEDEEGGGGGGGGGGGTERGENVPEAVHSYLMDNEAKLYEGTATDKTGSGEVSISVGGGDQGLAFDPPAVLVDPGTTITWEWTGNGGSHNVESADSSANEFRSGEPVGAAGTTYTQTFDSGNQLYFCSPHSGLGMHGAVIVSGDGGSMDG